MILCKNVDADGNYPSDAGVLANGAGKWLLMVDLAATGTFALQVLNSDGDWLAYPSMTTTDADTVKVVELQGVYVRGVVSGAVGTPQCTAELMPIQ